MRRILACLAVACLAATAHAASAAKVELVTPVQLGVYQSDASPEGNITLTAPALNNAAYRAALAGQRDTNFVAFARLNCTPYLLKMTLSKTVSGKPFITSVFVAVDADGKRFTVPEMLPRDDPENPASFILENVKKASSVEGQLGLFASIAAKGCQYFKQYKLGQQAEVLTRQ